MDWFWEAFGGCFGGPFRNLGILFPSCVNIFDFLCFWKDKLLKFTRCSGLEALEEDFGIDFGGYLVRKGIKFDDILNDKVDRRREWHAKFNQGANGMLPCQKFSSR